MTQPSWVLTQGDTPIVAVALHDGHDVREEVAALLELSEANRWREEDPFTAIWVRLADTQIVVKRSRFEFDLNRAREKAVYIKPESAWGLNVWKTIPPKEIIARSLAEYDAFYAAIERVFADLERRFGRFVVFELHTYNHRRLGTTSLPADPKYNPEINLGTGKLDRDRWKPVIESFLTDLQNFDFLGRKLDVRENIKFRGGYFPYWMHQKFPKSACVLSIEVKKFFMDEWTTQPDLEQLEAIGCALKSTVPGILEALKQV
jgi:hypothetical protein